MEKNNDLFIITFEKQARYMKSPFVIGFVQLGAQRANSAASRNIYWENIRKRKQDREILLDDKAILNNFSTSIN